ncbi:efflux RND transporter periplasmic adaptor subunit [Joostella sp. CR20]|uniref:efflux RND transporter periplasmic adaptor subunit n=1 Tax=Joostella sp. CR20 TaxID=2804312 RepID=UPI00313C64DC
MKNKKIKIIAFVAIALIGVGVAYKLLNKSTTAPITVETIVAKKGNVTKMVTATGTVQPLTEVEVGTQVSGEVEKIYVDFNTEVKKGQLIAELDKTNLKAALAQAKATYNNALNEKLYLQKIYDRQKTLFDNRVISEADYDEALYNLNTAKNTVDQRYSDYQQAKTNLSYADIYSPIDGVVLSKEIDEGQTVAASFETPTLFTIAKDLKEMQVEADVDEADIGEVQEGQRVTFTVDAYQQQEFVGEVTQVRLNPTEESNVITYTVVIKADNPEQKLKPGLTATVYIYSLELQNTLTVEAKAVNFQPDMNVLHAYELQEGIAIKPKELNQPTASESILWVLDGKEIQPKKVKLGQSDGVNVQVLSGISEGDKLVYNLKASSVMSAPPGDNESPFMPKPPGKKK